jgi:diguanylate cyclase (GGDEF)-like protein
VISVLGQDNGETAEILKQVEDVRREKANSLYSDLIYTLTHLHFGETQAKHHWEKILQHKQEMSGILGRNVGIRVALLDYFINLQQKIDNPKIIEIDLFEKTMLSAVTDGLTGLYNHRYFQDRLDEEVERARRYGMPLSLLMVDVDDFKVYNDANGHIAGDVLLVEISKILLKAVRKVDAVARYGGEEFSVILPSTKKKGALTIAWRICQKVAAAHFPNQIVMPQKNVTVSIGVATFPEDAGEKVMLLDCADKLLYQAKALGKNQAFGISKEE